MAKIDSQILETSTLSDKVKWILGLALLAAGLVANYHFVALSLSLRVVAWIGILAVVLGLILWTASGKTFLAFAAEARVELQKVVWPTRKETVQTTLIVVVMVVLVALILWGVDSILLWLIGLLTGVRG